MTRRLVDRFALPAAFGVAAVVTALATVAIGLRWTDSSHASSPVPAGPPLRAFATLGSQESFFGDVVHARLEVVVDRSRLTSDPLSITAAFAPYRVASSSRTRETLGAGYERLVYDYRLRCLAQTCIPPVGANRTFTFPAVRVAVGSREISAAWPPLVVASRIHGTPTLRSQNLRDLPAFAATHDRGLARTLWLGVGLGLAGTVLLGWWAARRERLAPAVASVSVTSTPILDPVSAACARVSGQLGRRPAESRRGALDHLARQLDAVGQRSLADETRVLAWGREPPADTVVLALLERVGERQPDEPELERPTAAA